MVKFRRLVFAAVMVAALVLPAAGVSAQTPPPIDIKVKAAFGPSNAPVIILIPGAFHCAEHLGPLQDKLALQGRTSVAISLRGHCGSPLWPGQPLQGVSMVDYANDVKRVIDDHPQWATFEFMVHSQGAAVARRFGEQYGTMGGRLKKVTYLAPMPFSGDRLNMVLGYYQGLPGGAAALGCFFQTFSMTCLRDFMIPLFVNSPIPQWAGYYRPLLTADESPDGFATAQALAGVDVFSGANEVPEVLVIPTGDRTIPPTLAEVDAAVIGATLQYIPGSHDYWFEKTP